MSMFINGSFGLPVTIHAPNDLRNCDQIVWSPRSRAPVRCVWANEMMNRSDNANDSFVYATRWWPKGSGPILGGWSGSADDVFQNYAPRWIAPNTIRGRNGRFAFVGYTRDAVGNVVGNCTVRLIRTSTDEQVAKVQSDANGLYYATSPYNDAHFIVIHNAAGDMAGATKNTLIPA